MTPKVLGRPQMCGSDQWKRKSIGGRRGRSPVILDAKDVPRYFYSEISISGHEQRGPRQSMGPLE